MIRKKVTILNLLNISLTRRYIPAVILISFFIIMSNIINMSAIDKNKELGKIINISGKQRMLSQKLVIAAANYISTKDLQYKSELEDVMIEMEQAHKYLLTKVFTDKLRKLYYYNNLNANLLCYFDIFHNLIKTNEQEYFDEARLEAAFILKQLNLAVKEYEEYAKEQLNTMLKYELILTFITLLVLLLEVVFIFRPASKQIEHDKKALNELNSNLQDKVKEQTKELQKNIDIVSNYVIFSKTNKKGIITEVSDAFCNISGYTRDELIGQPHNIIRHHDMHKDIFKDVWETIENDHVWSGEIKNLGKNGDYYWTSTIITPEKDLAGNHIGYMAIRHDITSKKDFELQSEQLIQSEKMASLGEMIGNIAHQWRQPLSTISTTISSMQVQKEIGILDDETFEVSCERTLENVDYLSKTIDTFRNFIKGEKVYREFVLQDEIAQAVGISSSILKDNNILLIDNINYKDKIKVRMTTGELPQVIINILNNAKDILLEKDISLPSVEISMNVEDSKVIIKIEDNAGGVPDNIITKIFEPYFTTKHQSQGTGLGLHMSYQIIHDSLNGQLYVKNSDKGAVFFIELPLDSKI